MVCDLIIDTRAPSPSEIIYIGRSPYINPSNGHWMEWDVSANSYIDTEVVARGLPAMFTANATALPAGSSPTASIGGTAVEPVLNLGIPKGDKGNTGDTGPAAGFGTPTASVDANVGTPSVQVTASGPNTAKVFNFAFKNLKGQKGDTGGVSSVNGKTGPVQLNDEDIPSTIDGKANVEAVLSYHSQQIGKLECLVVNCGTISSLPTTITNANIEDDMVVLQSTLGTPSAQTADWTVTTAAGSLTISGSISGSTTLTLYLAKSR